MTDLLYKKPSRISMQASRGVWEKCIIVQVCHFVMSEASLTAAKAGDFEVSVFNADANAGTVCVLL
jgi:hypothetical protein